MYPSQASHLIKSPSGCWHFKLRIPKKAQPYYNGRKVIKKSLKTKKRREAESLSRKLYEAHMKKIREDTTLGDFVLEYLDGMKVTIKHDTPEQELAAAKELLKEGWNHANKEEYGYFAKQSSSPDSGIDLVIDLPKLVEQFLTDTEDTVTPRTQIERRGALTAYMSLCNTISHKSANLFADTLKRLPPGFSKDNILELSKQQHDKIISQTTFNKYIALVGSFNNWLVRRGIVDRNFFTGLKIKRTKQTHLEREPFTPGEIKLLLAETYDLKGFQYFLPRLGLTSGCRLNELSQLYVEDVIEEEDGILCLNITDKRDDQHLKNMASRRLVPVHPDLVDEFKEYLSTLTSDRVFPDLTWTEASYYGGKSSKWFARLRKKMRLKPTFHSLRHTFASLLQDKGVDSRIIGELLGHASPGETGRYTGKRSPKILLEAVSLLEFDANLGSLDDASDLDLGKLLE